MNRMQDFRLVIIKYLESLMQHQQTVRSTNVICNLFVAVISCLSTHVLVMTVPILFWVAVAMLYQSSGCLLTFSLLSFVVIPTAPII